LEITGRHGPSKNISVGLFIGKISERGAGLFEGCPEENDEKSNHVNNCNALFFYFSERTIGDNISRNDNTKRENKCSDQIEFESKMKKAEQCYQSESPYNKLLNVLR
jgi:hypothetical protein